MLKKIAKRINKELAQAEDYVEQAFLVKDRYKHLADTFALLAKEEIQHAERLIKEGKMMYEMNTTDETMNEHKAHCKTIWEWEMRLVNEEILKLNYKLSKY